MEMLWISKRVLIDHTKSLNLPLENPLPSLSKRDKMAERTSGIQYDNVDVEKGVYDCSIYKFCFVLFFRKKYTIF